MYNVGETGEMVAAYTTNACSAVRISFMTPRQDLVQYFNKEYEPAMTHQIFGPSETIFGYKDLKIQLQYNLSSGHCFVKVSYSSTIIHSVLVPDNVWSKLRCVLPGDFFTDYYDYVTQQVSSDKMYKYYGIPKYEFSISAGGSAPCIFNRFQARLCSVNEPGFVETHQRFQTLLLWYIDGANFIDLDDPHWEIIYAYTSREGVATVVGFCTVYKFYAHCEQIRARISQFIIFPPYRRCGVGVRFLRCVYSIIRDTIPNLKDITVEDPNENFRLIRAINNVDSVFFSDAMEKYSPSGLNDTALKKEITAIFKLSTRESRDTCELITYIVACMQNSASVKDLIIKKRKRRLEKEYSRILKRCRHSLKYKRTLSSDTVASASAPREAEFLKMAATIKKKFIENFNVDRID